MNRRISPFVLAAVASVVCGSSLRAAPLDDRVPGDSLVYVGWAGSEALAPAYGNSNLKGFVDATGAAAFVKEQFPKVVSQVVGRDPRNLENVAKLREGVEIAWRHPVAFYMQPIGMTNPNSPDFHLGIVCDVGADAGR